MTPELLVAGAMLVALTFYALLGGADYGGGVWDLFAIGPRAKAQRNLIADAIGPVWEANHVWLILVVVLLFSCFPSAFSLISTALHIPLAAMLIGIVLRGAAFIFRAYDDRHDTVQLRWSRLFGISSLITPVLLGMTVGAISSGRIVKPSATTTFAEVFVAPWLGVYPLTVGLFALVLFAYLAALYLCVEAEGTPALQEDFRRRALIAGVVAGPVALAVFLAAGHGAPTIRASLANSWFTWPLQGTTAAVAVGALAAMWTRRYRLAIPLAGAQVTLILWGWALAQFPYLVVPSLSLQEAAAPAVTLRLVLWTLLAGGVVLFPSLGYLFKVFKTERTQRT